jgi:hypothetical protein
MCYADMTFCRWHNGCIRHSLDNPCPRALTVTVEVAAEKLGLPICQFIEPPECFNKPFSTNGESAENNE